MLGNSALRRLFTIHSTQISCGPLARLNLFGENSFSYNNAASCLQNNLLKSQILQKTVFLNALQIQVRNYAARRGTRERKEKLKKKRKKEKIEEPKLPWLLRKKKEKEASKVYRTQRPVDYSHLGHPIDNVYFYHKYDVHRWNFAEAVQNHRELHHPSMYNRPNCPLLVRMHLDFRYPNRPNKFQDGWKSVVEMKLPFLLPGMAAPTVLAFCPNDESMIADAIEAGADLAGGSDLIRSVQSGAVNPNDYEYIVAHPQLIVELTAIRGLMKRKFPNLKTKTLDVDIVTLVKKFKAGMKIAGQKTDLEPDYGWVEAPIGTLDMDIEGMEGNFESIFADTITHRVAGRTTETFVLGCVLKTAYSFEQFKLNTDKYFLKYDKKATKPTAEVTEETSEETGEQEESVQKEKATSS